MNPFHNPLDPFGAPGDPMEEVLSLQTYGDTLGSVPTDAEQPTNGCTSTCTYGCTTSSCPPPK